METSIEVPPRDRYNQELVSNVHPADWKNPEPKGRYNLVVIGAGTAGLVTAAGAAGLGARVALIERRLMGGDCLNFGCVPSKALIRSARAAADHRSSSRFGIDVQGPAESNFEQIMQRMRRLRAGISRHDSVRRFSELGVDVFLGEARFLDGSALQVGDSTLRFKKAAIATGARPVVPPIPGLEEAGFLTNESVFSLTRLPSRFLVIGGGPIGVELAQSFARLGSCVTLVEMGTHFLPREDQDAAAILERRMIEEGVDLRLETTVSKVACEGPVKRVFLEKEGSAEPVEADEILLAVGRAPNVEDLDLEAAGIRYDRRRGIETNDRLQTSNRRIYAVGDVTLSHQFTHTADASARLVIQNALFFGRKKMSDLVVPWCTYSSPEIAHVGLYEREAQEKGIRVQTFKVDLKEVDRAVLDGESDGFIKIHVKSGSDRILGATIVAEHAGEMISEITLAMSSGIGLGSISNVIHPYPTQAEVIRKTADAYNRTRLTPLVKKILGAWLRWAR